MTIVGQEQDTSRIGAAYARNASVPELVTAVASERPDTLALTADGRSLTYGELDRWANRLAIHLRTLGVRTDVPVGLCLPRSVEMVVGALGILKAGGAYVPMDPAYPADRLKFMLDDADAPVLISSPDLASRLPATKRTIVFVNTPAVDDRAAGAPAIDIAESDLAYLIYTSGSTGQPKGVEVAHGGVANLVAWHNSAFSITASDRASHMAGLGFDAAVWELWPYLAAGASVHMVDDTTRNSAELLRDWLVAHRITVAFVPTPLAERMITRCEAWPRSDLRIMLTGGDVLHHYPPADLPFSFINNYGPTECTVVATSGRVEPQASPDMPPPIGRGIANVEIHLLDEHRQPVPPGTPGEIHVGGASLARGYHNRPDLTAEKFIPDPFGDDPQGRLYRTGDLGQLLPDGQIAFLGRIDNQIKIRGYRVEPGEIEVALNRHQDIRASLVVAREDTPGDKRLVAYVVPASGTTPSHTELREFLREFLPEYMVPAAFVKLDAFALTPNGKVDRAVLPLPDPANTLQDDETLSDECTPTEQRVAEILGELLKLEEIGLDDNFFLLGGHSLLGAQLMARLRETFGVEIGLRSLFEAPTVAALSAEVDRLVAVSTGNGDRAG